LIDLARPPLSLVGRAVLTLYNSMHHSRLPDDVCPMNPDFFAEGGDGSTIAFA
jgi:hypothetical protein